MSWKHQHGVCIKLFCVAIKKQLLLSPQYRPKFHNSRYIYKKNIKKLNVKSTRISRGRSYFIRSSGRPIRRRTLPTMADVVQYRLERMVDELDDLEERGIFTRQEIAEIVKQRRKFEYRLKRPSPLKQDYLAYIEYETHVDEMRRARKESVAPELKKQRIDNANKKRKKKKKNSVSDYAGVSRILRIFDLAVMRFKGDIDLWFRYLEFCRQRNNGRMKEVAPLLLLFVLVLCLFF